MMTNSTKFEDKVTEQGKPRGVTTLICYCVPNIEKAKTKFLEVVYLRRDSDNINRST